ncbi:Hypothetical_protein [Hexamita inflata]|uniref:Hypothetical_protein n=1 Tax=Hexamita inflata TaxID=28002 RepID=A0ABP1HCH2_9EUKA
MQQINQKKNKLELTLQTKKAIMNIALLTNCREAAAFQIQMEEDFKHIIKEYGLVSMSLQNKSEKDKGLTKDGHQQSIKQSQFATLKTPKMFNFSRISSCRSSVSTGSQNRERSKANSGFFNLNQINEEIKKNTLDPYFILRTEKVLNIAAAECVLDKQDSNRISIPTNYQKLTQLIQKTINELKTIQKDNKNGFVNKLLSPYFQNRDDEEDIYEPPEYVIREQEQRNKTRQVLQRLRARGDIKGITCYTPGFNIEKIHQKQCTNTEIINYYCKLIEKQQFNATEYKYQLERKTPLQVNNKWIIYLLNIVIIVYDYHYYIIII